MFRTSDSNPALSSDLQNVILQDMVGLSPTPDSPKLSSSLPQDDEATVPDIAILNEEIPSPPPPEKAKTSSPTLLQTTSLSPFSDLPTCSLPIAAPVVPTSTVHDNPSPNSPSRKRRDHHNTHTRRCRARLNGRFDSLNSMLPLTSAEPRQKVHILDRAIDMLASLHTDNQRLARRLALRSPGYMLVWIDSFTRPASNMIQATTPLVTLVCEQGGFPYAELWQLDSPMEKSATLAAPFLHAPPMLETGLKALALASGSGEVPVAQLATGAFQKGGVTWFSAADEMHCERRARLADARIRSGLAVPMAVAGHVTHMLVFYDVKESVCDAEVERIASFGAASIGNLYGCPARKAALK